MAKSATLSKKKYIFYNNENPGAGNFFMKANMLKGTWRKIILHGATVELTDEQYKHIVHDCALLDYQLVNDIATGSLIPGPAVKTPRFQLQPVL